MLALRKLGREGLESLAIWLGCRAMMDACVTAHEQTSVVNQCGDNPSPAARR